MQWVLKEITEENKLQKVKLSKELNISETLSHLLILRDIKSFEDARKFFRPQWSDLYSPFLMHDMEKAMNRLHQAIENKEKILIYGDYDVDGTTAVSAMYLFLQQFTNKNLLDYYIPDRFEEGYGVSYEGVKYARQNDFSLMIILDCGIKEAEKIHHAQSIGIDCIIADHHVPEGIVPGACAVLNPKKTNCNYPSKELTGCGIGLKLMQAYCIKNKLKEDYWSKFIDYVAVSTAADIVPINDENRVLVYYGLEKINKYPSVGLKKLSDVAFLKRNRKIKVSDLVFMLAPRINAAGRLEHGSKAVKLLISRDETEAEKCAKDLHDVNTQRQDLDKQTLEEAIQIIEKDDTFTQKKTTVVYKENWNKGIVGIVAAKLVEKYYRPTVVLTEHNGYITGSARSIDGFDLYEALLSCKEFIHQFGGHKYAAGLSIEKNNLERFVHHFEQSVQAFITEEQQVKKIYVDAVLNLNEIDTKFINILKQFEPHGPSNLHPVFWIKKVKDSGRMHEHGNGHLKMYLTQHSQKEYPAIFFNGIKHFDTFKGKTFDCLCKIDIQDIVSDEAVYSIYIQDIK